MSVCLSTIFCLYNFLAGEKRVGSDCQAFIVYRTCYMKSLFFRTCVDALRPSQHLLVIFLLVPHVGYMYKSATVTFHYIRLFSGDKRSYILTSTHPTYNLKAQSTQQRNAM